MSSEEDDVESQMLDLDHPPMAHGSRPASIALHIVDLPRCSPRRASDVRELGATTELDLVHPAAWLQTGPRP
ncbi:hypothetical protein [Nannocystis pusilla]|uniref:hypothetical protein n=1 Tax=Nannocystis pusilla TaxID=889268 RepID=UPI003B7E2434